MRGEAGRITPPAAFPLGGGAYTFAPPPSIPMALNFVAQPQARGVALRPSPSAPVVYTMPSDASDPPPRRKTSHEDRHDLVKSWSSVTFSPPRSASPLVFEPCAFEVSVPGRTGKTEKTFFRCQACNATSTPEVRVGPDGKRNLCNKYAAITSTLARSVLLAHSSIKHMGHVRGQIANGSTTLPSLCWSAIRRIPATVFRVLISPSTDAGFAMPSAGATRRTCGVACL